ncbi:MAG: hypothetical protein ACRC67_39325 [Inquilinus sp.]|uniref:hypothetical protein n=1 Tax=Inquilinus sp. TaxID=1932117 RepID=UPI003F2B11A8
MTVQALFNEPACGAGSTGARATIMAIKYSVIEFAGCIDERVFADFRTLEDARRWMHDAYDPLEIETLNVRIAREVDGDHIYEADEPLVAAQAGGCWDRCQGSAGRSGSKRHAGDRLPMAANSPAAALHHQLFSMGEAALLREL